MPVSIVISRLRLMTLIPKGTILGNLYAIAQFQVWYSHQLMYIS